MDLKPLLHVCKGAGTTTALAGVAQQLILQGRPVHLLVATVRRADEVARQFKLPRHFVLATLEAARNGFTRRPGVLLCDTDALLELQVEADRQASRVAEFQAQARALQAQVRDLEAWQASARDMAEIKAEEVRDLSATVGRVLEERDQLAMEANNLKADLDDLRHVRENADRLAAEQAEERRTMAELRQDRADARCARTEALAEVERLEGVVDLARQYREHMRKYWGNSDALRRYGELERCLDDALGLPPRDNGASPDRPA